MCIELTLVTSSSLLRLLRKEREVMRSVLDLGLTSEQAIDLLTHPTISKAQADSGVLDGIFDASDRPEDGGVLVWLNDFEKDKRYERWGSALSLVCSSLSSLNSFSSASHAYPGSFFVLCTLARCQQSSKTSLISFLLSTFHSQARSISSVEW